MMTDYSKKSTTAEIRQRFDGDVERFSNLDTGQVAMLDSPLMMELVTQAAAACHPAATSLLDVGCGAGNYSVKLLQRLPHLDVTLNDLSRPMLDRAVLRVSELTTGIVTAHQEDIRHLTLESEQFDIILAAAVLHHLRDDAEWEAVFAQFYRALKPGGSIWIVDLIEHDHRPIQELMWQRYGDYLTAVKDEAYRDLIYSYIAQEDTPRPLMYQIDLLRRVGFGTVDILHKTSCFAAFGGVKS